MSTTIKSILALVVIAAAGAALWWSGWLNNIGLMAPQQEATPTSAPIVTDDATAVNDLPTGAGDTSDAALVQDTASLDAQVQSNSNDLTQIDQGLADKSIAQQSTVSASTLTAAKTKTAQELDRRIAALAALTARINAMTKITPELKTNINTVIQNQIAAFTQLKADIAATTTAAGVQTGVTAVNDSYRVYALIMPQASVIAASDRIVTVNNMLNGIGLKLKARLEAAQAAGADVTPLAAVLTDLGTKIDSANAHAQAAVNGTVTLLPDEGDKAKMAANTKALTDARADIAAAHADIVAARNDIATLISGLATLQVTDGKGGDIGQ